MELRHIGLIKHQSDQAIAEHQNLAEIAEAIRATGRQASIIAWERIEAIGGGPWPSDLGPRPDLLIEITTWGRPVNCVPTLALVWRPMGTWTPDFLHYDFYATASTKAYEHLRITYRQDLPCEPLVLDHTLDALSTVSYDSRLPRVFYVGTNWDRSVFRGGRAHGLLKALDGYGLIDIYGPRESPRGLNVWGDFRSYKGPLEFAPGAVPEAASHYRGVLALTTGSHAASEICTSRAFEGASAGCIVFAPDRPEFRRVLGDSGVYFDEFAMYANWKRDRVFLMETLELIRESLQSSHWSKQGQATYDRFVTRFQLTPQVRLVLEKLETLKQSDRTASLTAHGQILHRQETGQAALALIPGPPERGFRQRARALFIAGRAATGNRWPALRRIAFRMFARFQN